MANEKEKKETPDTQQKEEAASKEHHTSPSSNLGSIFLGILLIAIGFLYFASNLGLLPSNLGINPLQLWPLIIVVIGLSILSSRGWASTILGSIVFLAVIAILGLGIAGGLRPDAITTDIRVTPDPDAKTALLQIDSGAGSITIEGGADELAEGTFRSTIAHILTESAMQGDVQHVSLISENDWQGFGTNFTNSLDLALGSALPYQLRIDSGASRIRLDLREVQTEAIDIDTGASSVELKLGDKVQRSHVSIDAGASSVSISLPQNAGARIMGDWALASRNLPQFTQVDGSTYQSTNYDTAERHIDIEVDLGVSSFNVNWE